MPDPKVPLNITYREYLIAHAVTGVVNYGSEHAEREATDVIALVDALLEKLDDSAVHERRKEQALKLMTEALAEWDDLTVGESRQPGTRLFVETLYNFAHGEF